MASGTVKWFNALKGYGFVVPDSGGADVFVHVTSVQRSGLRLLEKGQRITFEVSPRGQGGKEWATDISPVEAGPAGDRRRAPQDRSEVRGLSRNAAFLRPLGTKPADPSVSFIQIL
jgi:cold shock protein